MARKRTGLSNRFRTGRSTYNAAGKGRTKDTYGRYEGGEISDIVAGRRLTYRPIAKVSLKDS